ncbi:MAG: hypothetical protein ABF649_22060 [Bacillus sp. (in: firmicutes)]
MNPYYQMSYPYRYSNEGPYFRVDFSALIGTFFTIPKAITLPTGAILPANTRVFIHTVTFLPSGEQSVTIVFPMQQGGVCIAGSTTLNASQISGSPVQTFRPY